MNGFWDKGWIFADFLGKKIENFIGKALARFIEIDLW